MSVSYDGHLIVNKEGIQPCCASMHDAIYADVIYKGTANKCPVVAIRMGEKQRNKAISFCPFCGARPEQRVSE